MARQGFISGRTYIVSISGKIFPNASRLNHSQTNRSRLLRLPASRRGRVLLEMTANLSWRARRVGFVTSASRYSCRRAGGCGCPVPVDDGAAGAGRGGEAHHLRAVEIRIDAGHDASRIKVSRSGIRFGHGGFPWRRCRRSVDGGDAACQSLFFRPGKALMPMHGRQGKARIRIAAKYVRCRPWRCRESRCAARVHGIARLQI